MNWRRGVGELPSQTVRFLTRFHSQIVGAVAQFDRTGLLNSRDLPDAGSAGMKSALCQFLS